MHQCSYHGCKSHINNTKQTASFKSSEPSALSGEDAAGRLKPKQQCSNTAKREKGTGIPAQPEAPLTNKPELVIAPHPTRSQRL